MSKKFPTITKGNLDTWNDITYGYIIAGMIAHNEAKDEDEYKIPYGELMTRANNLTNLLFTALRKEMGVRTTPIHTEF